MTSVDSRPYRRLGIGALEQEGLRAWQDAPTLLAVLEELQHRATDRAELLRDSIAERLAQLAAVPSETRDVEPGDPPSMSPRMSPTPSADLSSLHADFQPIIAPDTASGLSAIGKVRARLLDLSGRNGLLNFHHAKR